MKQAGESGLGVRVAAFLRRTDVSTVLLGVLVSLLTWFIAFHEPAPNIDQSWQGGMYMAIHDGVQYGNDIVYTYGPLGFLTVAAGWYTGLATIAFLWLATTYVLLACVLVHALRRTFGAIAATAIAFVALALLGTDINVALALAAIAAFELLRGERTGHRERAIWAVVISGSLLAAIEVLVKVSIGPQIFFVLLLALLGARAGGRRIGIFAGLFIVELLALWLILGQSLGDLPAYVSNSRELISGYSEAITLRNPDDANQTVSLVAAVVMIPLLVAGAAMVPYRDRLARYAGIGIALALAFTCSKEGSVLAERHHFGECFGTAFVVWIALPWTRSRRDLALAGAGVVALVGVGTFSLYQGQRDFAMDRFHVTTNVRNAFSETGKLFDPGTRSDRAAFVRLAMQAQYQLRPDMVSQVEGQTVAIDPWEIAAAWAYDLDWDPLPVIQNYAAYTEKLDQLNSDRAASSEGPDRILRFNAIEVLPGFEHRGYGNRWQGWDPPGQSIAILCNFETLSTSRIWQVLGRVPERCGDPTMVASVDASYGETVDVPEPGPGEVVFARVDGVGVSGLEKLKTMLWHADFRYAEFDNGRRWRLVPGTAGNGLLLRGPATLTGRGEFAQAPQTTTLKIDGPGGELRYDFYAMSVEPTSAERARLAGGAD